MLAFNSWTVSKSKRVERSLEEKCQILFSTDTVTSVLHLDCIIPRAVMHVCLCAWKHFIKARMRAQIIAEHTTATGLLDFCLINSCTGLFPTIWGLTTQDILQIL